MDKREHIIEHLREYLLPERVERIKNVVENRTRMIHVAVEDTKHERNAGALFRTCDCFGIQDVSIIEKAYNRKVTQIISKGSEKWLHINKYNDENGRITADCIDDLRSKGYQIVATTPHKADVELTDFQITEKTALLFGTEKEGLSEEALQHADVRLTIPIYGFTESYNISVSAALILQTLVTQLRQSDLPWQLNKEERLELELEWIKRSIGRSAEELYQSALSAVH